MRKNQIQGTQAVFPTTCWTAILSLKNGHSQETRNTARASLCEIYWYPLYAFARHKGKKPHDAQDAVQGFFLSILHGNYFEHADHNKGKMRTFLLTAFTRYMKDEQIRANAQKRGGGITLISLDADQAEEWLQADPNSLNNSANLNFEKNWALSTIRAAINHLRRESLASEKSAAQFEILSRFLTPETCQDITPKQAAEALNISTEACYKAIQRLRQDFRITVRELVASTLEKADDESIMEEMIQLQKSLIAT